MAEEAKVIKKKSRLKWIRQMRGLSQSQLADLAGVSLRMIQYYEQGRKCIDKCQAYTLYKIATALDCTMENLMQHDQPDEMI